MDGWIAREEDIILCVVSSHLTCVHSFIQWCEDDGLIYSVFNKVFLYLSCFS